MRFPLPSSSRSYAHARVLDSKYRLALLDHVSERPRIVAANLHRYCLSKESVGAADCTGCAVTHIISVARFAREPAFPQSPRSILVQACNGPSNSEWTGTTRGPGRADLASAEIEKKSSRAETGHLPFTAGIGYAHCSEHPPTKHECRLIAHARGTGDLV